MIFLSEIHHIRSVLTLLLCFALFLHNFHSEIYPESPTRFAGSCAVLDRSLHFSFAYLLEFF